MATRDPIIGDLLEEYREVVLPERGRMRAALWFARQLASLVKPWMWGALLGAILGLENVVNTAYRPLAEDDGVTLLMLLAIALTVWSLVGFRAAARHGRWADGVTASVAASAATMVVSQAANFARVLIFADRLQYNHEWNSLMARFAASGMTSLRLFVFREYAWGIPLFVATFVAAGVVCGAIASAISVMHDARSSRGRA